MGNRRIYLGSETSKYAKIAGGAVITITSLFFVLIYMGFTITGTNDVCKGTPDNPCVSYGKICNTGPNNYDIYNPDGIKLDFSPDIKNYWIFFKDGRVKSEFLEPLGINQSTKGYRYENFTNSTKSRSDVLYVHRFARYSCQDYMLVALKNDPRQTIKWGMGIKNDYLDPFFYGVSQVTDLDIELGSQVNISANISGAVSTCVSIDHPEYNSTYACGTPTVTFPFNISYFRKNELNDSSTDKNLTFEDGVNQTVYIRVHQYDEVNNLSINLTGYETDGTFPTNVKIYINGSLSNNVGLVGGTGSLLLNSLNDTNTSKVLQYISTPPETKTEYFYLPKSAEVLNAQMNLTGADFIRGDYDSPGVYDEINDSSINPTLWDTASSSNYYSYSASVSEGTDYLSAIATGSSPCVASANANSQTKDLPALSEINNITTRVYLSSNNNAGVTVYFSAFGTTIYQITASLSSDDSVWTIIKNTTLSGNGTYYFDVYNDGVFSKQINSNSNNILKISSSVVCNTGSARIYYVYYNSDDSIKNPSLEVGVVDGSHEWDYNGFFDFQNRTDNFNDSINSYLNSCTSDSNGYCTVPLYLTSKGRGNITISDINIIYTNKVGSVTLDKDLIESYLGNSNGYSNIPITFNNTANGTLEINDIRYDYAGGNDTIEALAYERIPAGEINSLDGNTSENLSFTGNQNFTRNITIPSLSNVTNASLNLSSYFLERNLRYTGDSFPLTTGNTRAGGITTNGTYFWITEPDYQRVYKYYFNGTYTGSFFSVAGEDINQAIGIAVDDNYLWITDGDKDYIHRYYHNGSYTGFNFTYQGGSSPYHISSNGTDLFVEDAGNDYMQIYKTDGTLLGTEVLNYLVNDGLDNDGEFMYVAYTPAGYVDLIPRFNMDDWSYVSGSYFNLSNNSNTEGIAVYGTYLYALDSRWGTDQGTQKVYKYILNDYIKNVSVSINNTQIWNYPGEFNQLDNQTLDFSSILNTALNSGSCDCVGCTLSGKNCTIPLTFNSYSGGILGYDNINISYEGDYNKSNNETLSFNVFYSDWDYSLPNDIDYLEFIPSRPTSKNVTPYGQTSSKPILNITTYNYGGKDMNLSIYLNNTDSCVNLTVSNTSSKSNGVQLTNNTWQYFFTNEDYLSNEGIWMWADYGCSQSYWRIWTPDIYFRGCAEGTICSEDIT